MPVHAILYVHVWVVLADSIALLLHACSELGGSRGVATRGAQPAPCVRQVWILVVVAVLSATMSESAIDSLQNAIVDNISGSFARNLPLVWVRALVLVLNVPVIVVSLQVCAARGGRSPSLIRQLPQAFTCWPPSVRVGPGGMPSAAPDT